MDTNLLVVLLIVGGLLLLSFLNIFNVTGVNRRANLYFGVFLLLWSSFWLDEILLIKHLEGKDAIYYLIRSIQFFTPIIFYFSVVFYTSPNYQFEIKDSYVLIMPMLFFLLIGLYLAEKNLLSSFIIVVFPTHALFYTFLSYYKIVKHQKDIELFSSNKDFIDLNWIKNIIYLVIISAVLIIIYTIIAASDFLNIYINFFFLGIVYFVAYFSIKQKEVFPLGYNKTDLLEQLNPSLENNSEKIKLMSDPELEFHKSKLLKLMTNEQPFLDSELNLFKLASLLSLSSHQLSYIINTGYDMNFFNFVNKFRVEKAKDLLLDLSFNKLTILSIGYESGFNSKTSFNTTFKKMTGFTPTEFKKMNSNL